MKHNEIDPSYIAIIQPDVLAQQIADYLLPRLQALLGENEPEQLLTQKEAAALLHCSRNTLIKWGRDGVVIPLRKGSRVYYRRNNLITLQTAGA